MLVDALASVAEAQQVAVLRIIVREHAARAEAVWTLERPREVAHPLGLEAREVELLPRRLRDAGECQYFLGGGEPSVDVDGNVEPVLVFASGWVRHADGLDVDGVELRHARADPATYLWVADVGSGERDRVEELFDAAIVVSAVHTGPYLVLRRENVKDVELARARDETSR